MVVPFIWLHMQNWKGKILKLIFFFRGIAVEDANFIVQSLAELIVTTKMKVNIDDVRHGF